MPSIPSGTPSFCIVSLFTGVPRLVAQVARPFNCGSYRLGVPHLGPQVAHPSELWALDLLELVIIARHPHFVQRMSPHLDLALCASLLFPSSELQRQFHQ
ncbi:hypothetical protein AHAS_Ahas06G0182200 [Arachis hypogaea]